MKSAERIMSCVCCRYNDKQNILIVEQYIYIICRKCTVYVTLGQFINTNEGLLAITTGLLYTVDYIMIIIIHISDLLCKHFENHWVNYIVFRRVDDTFRIYVKQYLRFLPAAP